MTGRTLQAAMDFPMEVGFSEDDKRFRREQRTKRAIKKAPLPDVTEECCLMCSRWMAPEREGERFGVCMELASAKVRGDRQVLTMAAAWTRGEEISRLRTAPGFKACDSYEGRDGSRRTQRTAGASAASTAATGEAGTYARAATGLHGLVAAVRASGLASALPTAWVELVDE